MNGGCSTKENGNHSEKLFGRMVLLLIFAILCASVESFSLSFPPSTVHCQGTSRTARKLAERNRCFSNDIVRALDLDPILERVASHTGTRRGRQAFLSLTGRRQESSPDRSSSFPTSAKRRRAAGLDIGSIRPKQRKLLEIPIAESAHDATRAYELTEQAMLAFAPPESNPYNLSFPPLYGANSGPWDTKTIAVTDDDDWLEFVSSEEWVLEHILQAEQVIGMLIRVQEWSQAENTRTWMPWLSDICQQMAVDKLQAVLGEIDGAVQVVRVRSLTDPEGRSSFSFQLNEQKYRVLSILREKQRVLQERASISSRLRDELLALTEELETLEEEIKLGLVQTVSNRREAIDNGLHTVAQLDVIFAKAAYGCNSNGYIPLVKSEGCIHVRNFVHPLLDMANDNAVPVDLLLSNEKGERALIISGPNGGGKTLAMKSFGVTAILTKLGIPIPCRPPQGEKSIPRVDCFQDILASIGDGQDVEHGQSTFTAQLNSYSALLDRVVVDDILQGSPDTSPNSRLVLIDEIGSGTEATSGGAIAQAVLEKLLEVKTSRIVVTTHSARLKALSYQADNEFACAAVLLKNTDDFSSYQLPAFQLKYGLIGESYALGAASRCMPPLPDDVLSRASALIEEGSKGEGGEGSSFNQALRHSLQAQLSLTEESRKSVESLAREMAQCRRAMILLAAGYDRHLKLLENRVESCYKSLRDADTETLELVGETLSELRVVRKRVKGEKELLRERGLRLLPSDYSLKEGESIVIVAEGEWDGTTAKVVSTDSASLRYQGFPVDSVAVVPSLDDGWGELVLSSSDTGESKDDSRLMVFQRYQLAIWDYDSIWEDDFSSAEEEVKSIPDSQRRLSTILSTMQTPAPKSKLGPRENTNQAESTASPMFKSARERKASRSKKKKKTGRK